MLPITMTSTVTVTAYLIKLKSLLTSFWILGEQSLWNNYCFSVVFYLRSKYCQDLNVGKWFPNCRRLDVMWSISKNLWEGLVNQQSFFYFYQTRIGLQYLTTWHNLKIAAKSKRKIRFTKIKNQIKINNNQCLGIITNDITRKIITY